MLSEHFADSVLAICLSLEANQEIKLIIVSIIIILPTKISPERISSKEIRLLPSRRSSKRSTTPFVT